jgi:predicted RecB family endonuclease
MTNLNRTNLNKPLKFTLENEEIVLHITSDIKTALQQQVEVSKHQAELLQEILATMVDMAAALIHLADKFPNIDNR